MCVSNLVRSIHSQNTAFFEIQNGGRQPSWIPNNANYEVTPRRAVIFCFRVSNFVKIGRSVPELPHCFEIQYGGRPPSWIPDNANFEVNLRTGVIFCLCVSNFMQIGQSAPDLRNFFESQYGGRSPSLIPEMYAYCQLALNRISSYANIENFMLIG
jgi:hypothetical protein